MPWTLRFAISWLVVFVIGAVIIARACLSTGWEAIGRFAWGLLTAGAGLIGSALFSTASAVIQRAVAHVFSRALGCLGFCCFFSCWFLPGLRDEASRLLYERARSRDAGDIHLAGGFCLRG